MRVVIFGQLQPGGPVAELTSAAGATPSELNGDIAAKLRDLADKFDPPPAAPTAAVDPAFEEIVRRYNEENGDGRAADL